MDLPLLNIVLLWLLCGLLGFLRTVDRTYGSYRTFFSRLWHNQAHSALQLLLILGGVFTMIFTSALWLYATTWIENFITKRSSQTTP